MKRKLTDKEKKIYTTELKRLKDTYDEEMAFLNCDLRYFRLLYDERLDLQHKKQKAQLLMQINEVNEQIIQKDKLIATYKDWLKNGVDMKEVEK